MAKHQIKNRWDESVLFECEVPDDISSGLSTRYALGQAVKAYANLTGANLADAKLTGAKLTGANLADANLTGAKLTGAKWKGGIVINKPPIQLFGLRWRVTILEKHMQIGCELHKLSDWAKYDDARIAAMDGRNALRFWRAHKDVLLGLARSADRGAATEPAPAPATAE